MAKKIIQDVLRGAEKSKKKEEEPESSVQPREIKRGSFFKKLFWFCVVIVIIFLGGVILTNFSSATIRITPHQEFIDIATELKAARESKEGLSFEIVQLEKEEIQTSPATGVAITGQKARGQIVVYNTFSSQSQKLISQTRFETPDGKIYRIQEPVVVPGNGSLEVTVYADKIGPEYNIGLTDFTIPGLKGGPRYEKIYARSKTEMKRGAKENTLIISEKDITNLKNILKQKIENYLTEKIIQQKPADFLLYKNTIKIDFLDDPANPKAGDISEKFTLKEKGKATGFLLKKDDLSRTLSENKNNVSVVNLEELDFNLLSKNSQETEITFSLKGRAHFVWNVDTNLLAISLMNVKDKNYGAVFKDYPEIEKAEIIFKPAWWYWVPNDKSRIHFETVLENK